MGSCTLATAGSRFPLATAEVQGGQKKIVALVSLSADYATGGDTLDLSGRGFSTVLGMNMLRVDADNDVEYRYIFVPGSAGAPATAKIMLCLEDGTSGIHADVAAMTDLSGVQFLAEFIGT